MTSSTPKSSSKVASEAEEKLTPASKEEEGSQVEQSKAGSKVEKSTPKSKEEGSKVEQSKAGSKVESKVEKSKDGSKVEKSKAGSKVEKSTPESKEEGSKVEQSKAGSKVEQSKTEKSTPASKEDGSKVEKSKDGSKAGSKAGSKVEKSKDGSKVEQSKAESAASGEERQQRITPSYVDSDPKAVSKFLPQAGTEGFTLDDRRMAYMKILLKMNVEKIRTEEGAQPADPNQPPFSKYSIELTDKSLERMGSRCRVVKASHADYPEAGMVAKIFEKDGLSEEKIPNRLYLQMLRQVGKKHPFVLSTWDIFQRADLIIIIQEFANRYDVGSFLSKYGQQEEQTICRWAQQLYKAMDFLGDMAICHRGIKPRRVLLVNSDLQVRLTGFYDAVIYWNPQKEAILNFPCIPPQRKSRDVPDYQAPEVYGDEKKEEFDPIIADIWSYGAVVYFMATLAYPHDVKQENPKIEEELQSNVQKVVKGTPELVSLLSQLLTTNAMMRLTFERIGRHPWFHDVFPGTAAVVAAGVVGPGGSISKSAGAGGASAAVKSKAAPLISVITAAGKSDAVTHAGKSAPASKVRSAAVSEAASKKEGSKVEQSKAGSKVEKSKDGSRVENSKAGSKVEKSTPARKEEGSQVEQSKASQSKVASKGGGKSKIKSSNQSKAVSGKRPASKASAAGGKSSFVSGSQLKSGGSKLVKSGKSVNKSGKSVSKSVKSGKTKVAPKSTVGGKTIASTSKVSTSKVSTSKVSTSKAPTSKAPTSKAPSSAAAASPPAPSVIKASSAVASKASKEAGSKVSSHQ